MPSDPRPEATPVLLIRILATAAMLAVGLWAAFHWMESEQELRVLCGQVDDGAPVEEVRAMFHTGLYLRSHLVLDEGGDRWVFDSAWSLGTATCTVPLDGSDQVQAGLYTSDLNLPDIAARVALPVLGGMALFQLMLALGAPIGHLAWGGAHRRLPSRLRGGSAAASLLFVAAGVAVLAARGWISWASSTSTAQTVLWVLVLVFGLSALANSASSRRGERWLGIPVTTVLVLCCAVLALGV